MKEKVKEEKRQKKAFTSGRNAAAELKVSYQNESAGCEKNRSAEMAMFWIIFNQNLPGHAGEVGKTQKTTHWLHALLQGSTSKVRFVTIILSKSKYV